METLLIQATFYVVDYFGRYGPIHNQFQQDLAKAETEFDANYTEVKWLSASELLRDNFLVKNQKSIYAYRRKKRRAESKNKTIWFKMGSSTLIQGKCGVRFELT